MKFETGETQIEIDLEKEKSKALQYLKDTDWYVMRESDIGKVMPEEVKQKRTEARSLL